MLTLEEAIRNWEEAGRHGTREERIARGKKWLPYYAYLAEKQDPEQCPIPETAREFVAALLADGAVRPGDRVLDIGAGVGNYALEFARQGCCVTALDASPECLEVLGARAEKWGLSHRIERIQGAWEEFIPAGKFDVTFSAMCPAICDMAELERMEAITSRLCCLITVTRGSYDKHRKAMMARLNIRPQGGMTTEALHYMNVLYLSGRQFQMKSMSVHSFRRVSAETVLAQYPIYFGIFGVEKSRSLPFLESYLRENAKDGFLDDESQMNLAMLYWDVQKGAVKNG